MQVERWLTVTSIAGQQHGLVTGRQVIAAGASRRAITRATAAKLLIPFRASVFLVSGVPTTEFTPLMAACLAAGPFTAASHLAAAWLHKMQLIVPGTLEITTYGDQQARLPDVRTHKSVFLHEDDRSLVHNIPVTSPPRTLMDLAAAVSSGLLPKLFDDLLRRHLCQPEEVMACVERIGGRGRAGTAFLRILAQERIDGHHPGDNDWEVGVARALAAAGYPAVPQFQVVFGKRVFIIDLAYPPYKIGVEFKGWDPRSVRTGFDHDADRDLLLGGGGWLILPATSRTTHSDLICAVRDSIARRKAARDRDLDI